MKNVLESLITQPLLKMYSLKLEVAPLVIYINSGLYVEPVIQRQIYYTKPHTPES